MGNECLICGAPLEYLAEPVEMECAVCRKKEASTARCRLGHYVCDTCHMDGVDALFALCLQETGKDPHEILRKLMALPFCHMHGPEHHILVGASLLTAYKNAGGTLELPEALRKMRERGSKVPGGICGFWGSCGAAISCGIFLSIVTGATPLATEAWGLSNRMTATALQSIGTVGGPRCCKRNGALAITEAVRFVQEQLGVSMELGPIVCTHCAENSQCIGSRCPYHP